MNGVQPYSALTIVSPACMGGEEKNQDRAAWRGQDLVASLSDGVSTSPNSASGADMLVRASPVLFKGDLRDRLGTLCDLLLLLRARAQEAGIDISDAANPALRRMMEEIAREKLAISHQTTLVALHLRPSEHMVLVDGVFCGDSAFFAYTPEGKLLASSINHPAILGKQAAKEAALPDVDWQQEIPFGPGDELLAKVLCDASERPALAERAGITKGSIGNWVICLPLDHLQEKACGPADHNIILRPGDVLMVPRYLLAFPDDPAERRYCRIRYSRSIRPAAGLAAAKPDLAFGGRSSVTAVLPDHFYSNNWTAFHERFERDIHFVLASDGFYGSFQDTRELWAWLQANRCVLEDDLTRLAVLQELHKRLADTSGDDDISFVWIRPNLSAYVHDNTRIARRSDHAR